MVSNLGRRTIHRESDESGEIVHVEVGTSDLPTQAVRGYGDEWTESVTREVLAQVLVRPALDVDANARAGELLVNEIEQFGGIGCRAEDDRFGLLLEKSKRDELGHGSSHLQTLPLAFAAPRR